MSLTDCRDYKFLQKKTTTNETKQIKICIMFEITTPTQFLEIRMCDFGPVPDQPNF